MESTVHLSSMAETHLVVCIHALAGSVWFTIHMYVCNLHPCTVNLTIVGVKGPSTTDHISIQLARENYFWARVCESGASHVTVKRCEKRICITTRHGDKKHWKCVTRANNNLNFNSCTLSWCWWTNCENPAHTQSYYYYYYYWHKSGTKCLKPNCSVNRYILCTRSVIVLCLGLRRKGLKFRSGAWELGSSGKRIEKTSTIIIVIHIVKTE